MQTGIHLYVEPKDKIVVKRGDFGSPHLVKINADAFLMFPDADKLAELRDAITEYLDAREESRIFDQHPGIDDAGQASETSIAAMMEAPCPPRE